MPHPQNRVSPAGRLSVLATGLYVAAALIGSGAAHGQSFDCRRARSADEWTICQESGLAQLDQELASLKRQRKEKHHKAERDEADDNETAFLNARRRCRENRGCIEQSYRNRIQELTRSSPEEEPEPPNRATAEPTAKTPEKQHVKAPALATRPAAEREAQPTGTSAAAAEPQRSGGEASRAEPAEDEPQKRQAKRRTPATAQTAEQPARSGTPTIQWVNPSPSP
jgi:uncharacterized protein